MSNKVEILLYVIVAVGIALLANYLAALWGSKGDRWSLLLIAVIAISPFVFITFGLVTSKVGVAIGSGTIDSLLTVATIILGLVVFGEWARFSLVHYFGLSMIVGGLVILHLIPEH